MTQLQQLCVAMPRNWASLYCYSFGYNKYNERIAVTKKVIRPATVAVWNVERSQVLARKWRLSFAWKLQWAFSYPQVNHQS